MRMKKATMGDLLAFRNSLPRAASVEPKAKAQRPTKSSRVNTTVCVRPKRGCLRGMEGDNSTHHAKMAKDGTVVCHCWKQN